MLPAAFHPPEGCAMGALKRGHGKPVKNRRGPRHCDRGRSTTEATGRAGKAVRADDPGVRRPTCRAFVNLEDGEPSCRASTQS